MRNELKVKYQDQNVLIKVACVAVDNGIVTYRISDDFYDFETMKKMKPFITERMADKKEAVKMYPDVVICEIWSDELDMMGDEVVFAYNTEIDRWVNLSTDLCYGFDLTDIFEKLIIPSNDNTCTSDKRKIMEQVKEELDRLDKEGADLHTIGLFKDNTLVAGRGMIDYWYDIIDGEIVCDVVIMDNDCEEHFIMSMTFDIDDVAGAASAVYTFGNSEN